MGFQDDLRSLSASNEGPRQRYSLDTAKIDVAARAILEELKGSLMAQARSGKSVRSGILGTKKSVTVMRRIDHDRSFTGTPCQRTRRSDGEEYTFWAFHDIAEAKLVAKRMSELGKADGIHVTVGKGMYNGQVFFATATY